MGPPEDYDLVAAMTFGLLCTLGLRQHHDVLDIGCGSLRVGREMGRAAGLRLTLLDWRHPPQTWGLFSPSRYYTSWIEIGLLTWNASLASGIWSP